MAAESASSSVAEGEKIDELTGESYADLLAEYDEMFQDRYTDMDPDYLLTRDLPLAPPPCVENWYIKPKRTFDWSRNDNRDRGRGNWQGRGGGRGGYGRGGDGRYYDRGYQGRGRGRHDHGGYRDRRYDDRNRGYGGERSYGGGQGHYRDRSDRVHYAGVRDPSHSHQRQGDRYHPYNR